MRKLEQDVRGIKSLDPLKRLHQPLGPPEESWQQYCLLAHLAIIILVYIGTGRTQVELRLPDDMAQQGHD